MCFIIPHCCVRTVKSATEGPSFSPLNTVMAGGCMFSIFGLLSDREWMETVGVSTTVTGRNLGLPVGEGNKRSLKSLLEREWKYVMEILLSCLLGGGCRLSLSPQTVYNLCVALRIWDEGIHCCRNQSPKFTWASRVSWRWKQKPLQWKSST